MAKYSKAILGSYNWVPRNEILDLDVTKEVLTCYSRGGIKKAPIPLYADTRGWFGYPRHYNYGGAKEVIDKRAKGELKHFKFTGEWRDYQIEPWRTFKEQLVSGKTGSVLVADPAFGKTVFLIAAMAYIGRPALVVVHKTDLIKQWTDQILQFSNLKRSDVGFVNGRKASWRNKTIVVGLVHSLALDYLGKEFKRYFGQVWFDEVHATVPPETFAPIVTYPAYFRGGASATPRRVDGMDEVYRFHIEEFVIYGKDPEKQIPKTLVINFRKGSGVLPGWASKIQRRGILISKLSKNTARNVLLAKMIYLQYKTGRQVAVMSERKLQLKKLQDLLTGMFGVPKNECGMYIGGTSPEKLKQMGDTKRVLFATSKMLGMATDIPALSGLVYATPMADTRQSDGRIKRSFTGKKRPVIIDIVDTKYDMTLRWAKGRKEYYRREHYPVTEVEA